MNRFALSAVVLAASVVAAPAQEEADPARGAELAGACAACHGESGISVSADIPNLAAQKDAYIVSQLEAFREGTRKNELMNAVASSLSDQDIADLAAHFSGLPGADPGATGEGLAALDGTRVSFPTNYRSRFVKYHVIDFPDRKQVRHYWVNPESVEAAKAGRDLPGGAIILTEVFDARLGPDGTPLTGTDEHFQAGDLTLYTAMQKIAAGGAQVPDIFANGNWRYSLFETNRTHRETNEAECLACHKPEVEKDYVFTYDRIAAAAE